jgi:hypothetical protein
MSKTTQIPLLNVRGKSTGPEKQSVKFGELVQENTEFEDKMKHAEDMMKQIMNEFDDEGNDEEL